MATAQIIKSATGKNKRRSFNFPFASLKVGQKFLLKSTDEALRSYVLLRAKNFASKSNKNFKISTTKLKSSFSVKRVA